MKDTHKTVLNYKENKNITAEFLSQQKHDSVENTNNHEQTSSSNNKPSCCIVRFFKSVIAFCNEVGDQASNSNNDPYTFH